MIASTSNQQNTWTHTTLNEFCGQRGQSIEPSKTPDLQFELYSVPSFPTGQPEIVSGKEVGSNKQMITSECVLLCKINPRINRAWVVGQFSHHTKIASTEWIVFPPDKRVEPRFLCYFFQQNAVRDFLASNVSGVGGSLMRVKPSTLRDFPFAYPGRDEQSSIVAEIEKQFSRLDESVANLKRVKSNLKRYKASVLKAAVEGKLTEDWRKAHPNVEPASKLLERILTERRAKWSGRGEHKEAASPDTGDLPVLPMNWKWATVDQLSMVVRGASPRPAGDPRYFGGIIPWITVGPITADQKPYLTAVPESVTEAGRERSRYIEPHTLLLTNSGATLGVPKITLIGGCINDGVAALLDVGYPLKLYLLYFLHTQTTQLRRVNQGAAQPNLNTSIIKAINVPLPPHDEQEQIVAEVERRLSVIEELEAAVEANLNRAHRLRQSILSNAFAGKLVCANISQAVSEVLTFKWRKA